VTIDRSDIENFKIQNNISDELFREMQAYAGIGG